jgi:septal ring factor EnvC (AmiA/AmiB activator)
MPFVKTIIRVGVIGTLVGGGLIAVAGPERVGAALTQARDTVNNTIDRNIDDPVKMRAQLRKLESQYPERIARVRQDLSTLDAQTSEYQRELAVAERVVELAQADLDAMQGIFAQAENVRAEAGHGVIVRVSFNGSKMDLSEAQSKAAEIAKTRDAYIAEADSIAGDIDLLGQQRERLTDLLVKLESEKAQFQSELWRLNQQIDAIARNERMIDMMEARQQTLDELGPYQAHSIDQVKDRLAQLRSEQEAKLESLASGEKGLSYEDRAKASIGSQRAPRAERVIEIEPTIVEIPEVEVEETRRVY